MLKKSLTLAVLAALSMGGAHASYLWTGPDSETPLQVDETLGKDDIPSGNFFYYTFANTSPQTVNNVSIDLTTTDQVSNQILALTVRGNGLEFAGDTLDVSLTTDCIGTGNSTAAGLYILGVKGTVSAETTSVTIKSSSSNGKALYGIVSNNGTDFDFTGKTVNVNIQTATDRGDDASQYSETMGIDAVGGKLHFSKDTTLNINVTSSGTTTTTPTTEGKNAKPGNFTGSTPIYGLKLEGGSIASEGTTNITLDSVGSKASGVYVTNFWNNSTSGSNWGDSNADLNDLNITVNTKTGDAYGVESGYTPKEGDTEIDPNTVLFSSADTRISVTSAEGSAYGIYASGQTTTEVTGNLSVTAAGVDDASTYSLCADAGLLKVTGSNNTLTGNVAVKNGATFTLGNDSGSTTTLNGSFESDATSSVTLNNANLELAAGETFTSEGDLTTDNAEIVLNSAQENALSIASLVEGSSLAVSASSTLNDELNGDISAFADSISIESGAEGTQLNMREGMVAGAVSAKLDETGAIKAGSEVRSSNSLMQSTLELAAAAPLAINRILMNDVRKRLGDVRSTPYASGAWVRYDGGRLSGNHGLENDFNTVQLGFDTTVGASGTRLGAAFSYTDGDADYARGSAEMNAYALSGYALWSADNGLFVDTVARIGKVDTDLVVDAGKKGSVDNVAASLSVEGGWRWNATQSLWVEPQVEATYTYISSEDFSIDTAKYDLDSTNSFIGRLGFAAGLECPQKRGNVYLRASVVHEFLGDAELTGRNAGSYGRETIDGEDTWIEYGIGGNIALTSQSYLWLDVERTSGGTLDEDWRANVGVRYMW